MTTYKKEPGHLPHATLPHVKRHAKIIAEFAMKEGILLENISPESISLLAHFYKFLEAHLRSIFHDAYCYGRRFDADWINKTDEERYEEVQSSWEMYRNEFFYNHPNSHEQIHSKP